MSHPWISQTAASTPFDNEGTIFVGETTRDVIIEIGATAAVSASPGFTWGDSGNIRNAYLLNDNVPSDTAGRLSPLNGYIAAVFLTCQDNTNGEFEIRKRDGATFTTLATISMGGVRKKLHVFTDPQPAVAFLDELSLFVNNTAAIKNPVAGLILKGATE